MTRKDYIKLAAALNEAKMHALLLNDSEPGDVFAAGIRAACKEIARVLEDDNANFKRGVFMHAAGQPINL